MAWGARQWCRITKEATFGTFDASAIAGDIAWITLDADNAFSMVQTPEFGEIRSAHAGNRVLQAYTNTTTLAGTLRTPFYHSQAALLLGWATTLTSNELSSFTIDHFDSIRTWRHLGCKVRRLRIAGSARAESGKIPLIFDLVGKKTESAAPTLAEPATSVFPTALPYMFQESVGGLVVRDSGSAVRTAYQSFALDIANILSAEHEEDRYVDEIAYCGRDVMLDVDFKYRSAADRALMEAATALVVKLTLTKGANSVLFDLLTNATIRSLGRNIPLGNLARESMQVKGAFVGASGTDLSITIA